MYCIINNVNNLNAGHIECINLSFYLEIYYNERKKVNISHKLF
jgi:hypothetical protein